MNKEPRFYIIEDSKMSFYAGYCIKPKNGLDIYELCDTLNSNAMKEYIEAVSRAIEGGINLTRRVF